MLSTQDLIEGVFANHDFSGEVAGREYIVQTTEVRRDGDVSIIAVDLTPTPMTDDTDGEGGTYHFRIEPVPEQ